MSNFAIGVDCFAGGASAPATIASILGASLVADYEPLPANLTLVGSKISVWNDQSGSGDPNKNATQATDANRPTLVSSDANFNGAPSASFPTTAQLMATGVWAAALPEPYMQFVVAMKTNNLASTYLLNSLGNPGGIFSVASNVEITDQAHTLASGVGIVMTPGIIVAVRNGASSSIAVRQNTPQASGNGGSGTITGLTLGNFAGGGFGAVGSIARIIVASGVVSTANIAAVTAILALKYGLVQGP